MSKIIIELILKIHLYYPIGMMQMYTEYPGRISFQNIIANKINDITNEKRTSWTLFVSDVEKEMKGHKVYNYSFDQFPSYYCEIELQKLEANNTKTDRKILINVSLLTNHYTVYFLDNYKCSRYGNDSLPETTLPFQYQIVYNRSSKNKSELDLIDILKTSINKYFPDYTFIEHSLLFNNEVEGGSPYNKIDEYSAFPEKKYCIYEYLFSDNIERSRMFILE